MWVRSRGFVVNKTNRKPNDLHNFVNADDESISIENHTNKRTRKKVRKFLEENQNVPIKSQ